MIKKELPQQVQKVQQILTNAGLTTQVIEFDESTRTAADAARAIGCEVAHIAKSLLFVAQSTKKPVLVIASGVNRVNEATLAQIIGEKIIKADAEYARAATGYAIGGIPPFGHVTKIDTFIDEDLFKYPQIWAAAGTPHTVFKLDSDKLIEFTGGRVISIK
jgi:Cys-tRNA(Pro) deacylase